MRTDSLKFILRIKARFAARLNFFPNKAEHCSAWLVFLVLQTVLPLSVAHGAQFNRAFAPQDGMVCQYEKPLREEICLNGTWHFQADPNTEVPGATLPRLSVWEKTPIKIPSPWNVNAFVMDGREQGGDFRAYPLYPKE
jgi:hypothetical protein